MTQAVALAQQASTGVSQGFKNRIINGAMTIDQRNAGAAVTLDNASNYTLDRWEGYDNTDGSFTVQRTTTAPTGFNNSLKVTVASTDTSLGSTQFAFIRQRIEGYNIADLGWGTANAKTITISFWVRSSLTGTFGGSITNNDGDRGYPFSYTISSANTWEQKSVTIVGDTTGTWNTTNGTGIIPVFGLGVGSAYSGTAGSWQAGFYLSTTGATNVMATNGATWYVTGVQLEVGSTATSFDTRDYTTELSLCQRYFEKSYAIGTAIGGTGNSSTDSIHSLLNMYNGSTGWVSGISYKIPKRAVPTVTLFKSDLNAGGAANDWAYYASGWVSHPGSMDWNGQNGFSLSMNSLSLVTNYTYLCAGCWASSAEL